MLYPVVLLLGCLGYAHSLFSPDDWISVFPSLGELNLDTGNYSLFIKKKDIPQMVLFTFTGTVDKEIRDALTEIFPDDILNPNGCPVGITLFVEGDGTDPCAVHRMYIRGHEIASSGYNHTLAHHKWRSGNWSEFYQTHREEMTAESYLDKNHVQGVRARSLILNNATSFTMLHEEHFLYDSSLVLQQPGDYKDIRTDIWPVFSFIPMSNLNWKNKKVWLIPVNPIVNPPYRARVYLDDCKMSRSEQVLGVLKKNFNQFYDNDRAPFQVNFRSDFVMDKDMRKGLRSFVDWLAIHEDVWLVTHQEAIEWMKAPFPQGEAEGLSECGKLRDYNSKCMMFLNKTTFAPFKDVLQTGDLWIYQTVLLFVSYFVVVMYDRFTHQKKK